MWISSRQPKRALMPWGGASLWILSWPLVSSTSVLSSTWFQLLSPGWPTAGQGVAGWELGRGAGGWDVVLALGSARRWFFGQWILHLTTISKGKRATLTSLVWVEEPAIAFNQVAPIMAGMWQVMLQCKQANSDCRCLAWWMSVTACVLLCHASWAQAALGIPDYAAHHLHSLGRPEMYVVQFWRIWSSFLLLLHTHFWTTLTININEIEIAFWITCFKALSRRLSKKQAASLEIKALSEIASNRKRQVRHH